MKKATWIVCLAIFGAAFAPGASAQENDEAIVPFMVNVNATVSATDGKTQKQISVTANQEATLRLPITSTDGILNGAQRRLNAPAVISNRNGKVTVNLSAQSYKNAEISLYTVNGKRISRSNASASSAENNILRRNIAAGAYLLSVRGAEGNAFTSRLTHNGGNLAVNVSFGGEDLSSGKGLAKKAANGDWTITVSSPGYVDSVYTLRPAAGNNARQNITLRPCTGDQCNSNGGVDSDGPGPWDPTWACPANVSAGGLDLTKENLGLAENYVVITFKNGSAPEVAFSDTVKGALGTSLGNKITITGEHVYFDVSHFYSNNGIPYNIILSGTAKNGSLRLNANSRTTLYLNGVDITNPAGPAINLQNKKRTDVHLVGSCDRRNKLTDGPNYAAADVQTKGTLFAEGSLIFGGTGSIEIRSKSNHAIVSDEFVEIGKGSGSVIIYESKNDGIHANERINVYGGLLQIKCEGDAIQNEGKKPLPVTISGGTIKIRTTGAKGHGIVGEEGGVIINNDSGTANINITLTGSGSKGIRSRGNVIIDNRDSIYIEAHGARESALEDTSSAAGIKADKDVEIKRGILTIKCTRANENGKGLNIDGNLKVSGGTTKIAADGHGIKVGGSLTMSGGYLESKSAQKRDIDCVGKVNKTGGTLVADNIKQGN